MSLSKVLIGAGFLYASYHINNLVQEYRNYVLEDGFTLSDLGFEGGEEGVRQKKKQQTRKGNNQQQIAESYLEELALLSQRGKNGFDKGDYKLAFQCFDRIVEISHEYPPFRQYARNANLFLIRIAQEADEPELYIKYNKAYIETFEEPQNEEIYEVVKCTEEIAEKLAQLGNVSEAIDFTKSTLKNKKYNLEGIHKIHLYSVLASLYKNNEKYQKKELDAHLRCVEYAKSSGDKNAYANYLYELIQYYIRVKNVEKIEESITEIEKLVSTQILIPIFRLLCTNFKKNNMYDLYVNTQNKMMDLARKEPSLGKANVENVITNCRNNIATTLFEKGDVEDSLKIYNELKRSEFLSFAPLTETKYLVTKEVESKNGTQKIVVVLKPNSLPEDSDKNIIECQFEGSYYLNDPVISQEEKEEEKEEKEEEEKQEEKQKVEVEESKVEEEQEQKEEKEEEKSSEEQEEQEENKEQEDKIVEEKEQEEKVEEPKAEEKVVYEEVAPVTVEKTIEKEVEFENDSSKLNPNVGYLATIKLYNHDKSELISTHMQLIPIQNPKHKLI